MCLGDGKCDYFPSPGSGPGTGFADFVGAPVEGEWQVCAGDANPNDFGVLDGALLHLDLM